MDLMINPVKPVFSVWSIKLIQRLLSIMLLSCLGSPPASANDTKTDTKTIVLLPFELIDSAAELIPFPEKDARLAAISHLLREKFVAEQLYTVLSSPEIDVEVARQQKRYDLADCNGCDQDIARVAGADRVLIAWVQRATALILNVNIEIRDVETGQTVLRKSSEIRGNTESNWRRAVRHIVRSMVEKGQANR